MDEVKNLVVVVDDCFFFEKVFCYGLDYGLFNWEYIGKIEVDGLKGIVQIVDYFGMVYLWIDLEMVMVWMINLISFYLEDFLNGDLCVVVILLCDNSLLLYLCGGFEMLK